MADLNVLSKVGGFKHYLAKDTLGLMGVLKHPKHPPKYAPASPAKTSKHSARVWSPSYAASKNLSKSAAQAADFRLRYFY